MIYFSADEHYGHANIIKYCHRPCGNVEEMDRMLIDGHNAIVTPRDTVVHVGDFAFGSYRQVHARYISKLNGIHIFLKGSHDSWLPKGRFLWEHEMDDGNYVVACHYPMLSWPRSHHGSWLLHGHTHGRLKGHSGMADVGVDANDFLPVSWEELRTRKLWR